MFSRGESSILNRGMVKMQKVGLRGKAEPFRDAEGHLEPLIDYPYAKVGTTLFSSFLPPLPPLPHYTGM